MENREIESLLMNSLPLQEVHVFGDSSHFRIIAVGDLFKSMNRVKKQQIIYEPLVEFIANNYIHALSIETYTTQEWKDNQNNRISNFS